MYYTFGSHMAKTLISIRVDRALLASAKRVLRAPSKSRTVERALETVVEMERHRRMIRRFGGKGKPGDFARS